MSSASISTYIWNVVSGVRSSCVTAVTNDARRLLKRMMPASRQAMVTAVAAMQAQATASETNIGESPGGSSAGSSPGTIRSGKAASIRDGSTAACRGTGSNVAAGKRSPTASASNSRMPVQSKRQPCTNSRPAAETRRAKEQVLTDPERRHRHAADVGGRERSRPGCY